MAIQNGWIYGIILVIVGSIGNNLGNNLVSLGHTIEQKKDDEENRLKKKHHETLSKPNIDINGNEVTIPSQDQHLLQNSSSFESLQLSTEAGGEDEKKDEQKSCFKSLRCLVTIIIYALIGTFIFIFGNLFTFVSFAFGAQSLIASLESTQFVSNIFFAKYVHKEIITRRMIFATLSIIIGNLLVVLFSSHSAQTFDSDQMIHLYKYNNIYHGYLVFAFFVWLGCSYVYRKYYHSRMILRTLLWKHSFLEPFCFSVSSSIIGTQAVLNSKCLALLIGSTTSGNKNEFKFWYVYFILGTWILLVIYWLKRLDLGLSLFPPLFIIPVMQVFFVFFAILCGGIYFQEFQSFSLSQYIGFIIGVLLILFGVYGLAPVDMVLYIPPLDEFETDESIKEQGCIDNINDNDDDLEKNLSSKQHIDHDEELDIALEKSIQKKPDPTLSSIKPNQSGLIYLNDDIDSTPPMKTNPDSTNAELNLKKNRKVVKRPTSLPPLLGITKSANDVKQQQQQQQQQQQHVTTDNGMNHSTQSHNHLPSNNGTITIANKDDELEEFANPSSLNHRNHENLDENPHNQSQVVQQPSHSLPTKSIDFINASPRVLSSRDNATVIMTPSISKENVFDTQ